MTKERLMELGNIEEANAEEILQEIAKEQAGQKELSEGGCEQLQLEYEEKMKQIATRYAIRTAGGKNERAILALVDWEKVQLQEDGTLTGLDLEKIKTEAPYLFEKVERKMQGTGFSTGTTKEKKNDTAKKFKDALLRR